VDSRRGGVPLVFHGVPAKHRDRVRCDGLRFRRTWVFLTNHAHVLLCIAQDPSSRARDIGGRLGITERATERILADVIADGYITRTKVGRRNHYEIDRRGELGHPVLRELSIGPLLDVLESGGRPSRGNRRES
jgi:hypothetical protein